MFDAAGGRALNGPQLGIWYAQRLAPTSPVFNMGGYLEIRGPFDRAAFAAASRAAAAEHDGLRLRFTEVDGVPVQRTGPAHDTDPDVVDLSGEPDPVAAALAHMRADMDTVVDPATGPFHHVVIYVLGPDHHITYGRVHHLVHDGLSAAMADRRVAELYTELVTGAPAGPPMGSFLKVLDEQAAYAGSKAAERDAAYWRSAMADAPRPAPPPRVAPRSGGSCTRPVTWTSPSWRGCGPWGCPGSTCWSRPPRSTARWRPGRATS
ncbi:condensation domain-containing protein [Actinokineospora soli]|uniref:Condensation domain-containing protein n=1 Tax=Actinokineospora soli TaxID=1048753 RepID=A0ABW2TRI1_9PSEU